MFCRLTKSIGFLRRFFNTVTQDDVAAFRNILGATNVLTEDIESYNEDWLRTHKGNSSLVLKPGTTEDVSKVLGYCSNRFLPLVIQAGKTSLVAGSVPTDNEIILSMSRLNKIESLDSTTGILRCQSGCILESLENHVSERGFRMPYDLGAKGSCQIGGNVATNAAGIHFIKYGSLHGTVLGLEVVTADGKVLDFMSAMRKDNTGYDLKQLFIGSEGTLGAITKVAILCPAKSSTVFVALLGLDKFEDFRKLLKTARYYLEDTITAFEMMDEASMQVVTENLNLQKPFNAKFYGLIEVSTNKSDFAEEQLSQLLEKSLSECVIVNGTYSYETAVSQRLWSLRERVTEGLLRDGYCYKYDVSLPFDKYYKLVSVVRHKVASTSAIRVTGYGHVSDLNLHLNVTSKSFDKDILQKLEPFIYEWVRKNNGSISAEHGIGLKKKNYLHYSKSAEAIEVMKKLKNIMDPHNILNPGKLFPSV